MEVFGHVAAVLTEALEAAGLPPEPALAAARTQPSRLAFEAAVRVLNGRGLPVVLTLDAVEQLCGNPLCWPLRSSGALVSCSGRQDQACLRLSQHRGRHLHESRMHDMRLYLRSGASPRWG